MPLHLDDCSFHGSALPEPFVKLELEAHLTKAGLWPKTAGVAGKAFERDWDVYRRKLNKLVAQGGPARVINHVFAPLLDTLGYARIERQEEVKTREALEDGGWLLQGPDGSSLRVWAVDLGTDLDAPTRRGHAYRFSPQRVAERVLDVSDQRVGLLTDGEELRIVLHDPARPGSHITIRLDRSGGWRGAVSVPDSYRLLLALASPAGVRAMPELVNKARLHQTQVTDTLRDQARQAVQDFVQELLDHPANAARLAGLTADAKALADQLWRESLILVYRLLFVLTLEAAPDPARVFSFASTSLWRNTYSPNTALARHARAVLDQGAETGNLLEGGLRTLFRMFANGLTSRELTVSALGGMLFGAQAMDLLDRLSWGERAVARLLDRLLWTPGTKKSERRRVHYGSLDVEDLGRVYEALLELEPGVTTAPMSRLRRSDLEVVVPAEQAAPYRAGQRRQSSVEFIEDIPAGRFYLRTGLGRKTTGSYYTPHPFVRFLVQETLGPQVAERSPMDNPQPIRILELHVLDPAMGSGHFLVEACRYLGERLYEACRLCDERAQDAERAAEQASTEAEREAALARAADFRRRVADLPDPNDELVTYLPSRAVEGAESGLSERKAQAMCRRLVAVHCLYGVDKNPLAVGLAKLALWLESHAEGLPLTFLDHRLIHGDSITGPFFDQLLTYPGTGQPIEDLLARGLNQALRARLADALKEVTNLRASVGTDLNDIERKEAAKQRLDRTLEPFRALATAWSGGVMLGPRRTIGTDGEEITGCDDGAYLALARAVAHEDDIDALRVALPALDRMMLTGAEGVPNDLVFPEVFYPDGDVEQRAGFDAVLGNPPWDALQPLAKEFFASYDLRILDAPTRKERAEVEDRLTADPEVQAAYAGYVGAIERTKTLVSRCYPRVNRQAGGAPSGAVTDIWQIFAERAVRVSRPNGMLGVVLPSAFHANQSATGVRELYLDEAALRCCYSFENRFKLFEIDSRFKFATVVAQRLELDEERGDPEFDCAFYVHDLDWLSKRTGALRYSRSFVHQTGGDYLTFLELRTTRDAEVASICYQNSELFGTVFKRFSIRCSEEMHMSKSSHLFTDITTVLEADPRQPDAMANLRAQGYLPLHEGKTFHQYTDSWEDRPRYLVQLDQIRDRDTWLGAACHYRLAFRAIARSTDERTAIFALLPPGCLFGNSAPCEKLPKRRPTFVALWICGITNTFSFDWALRQKAAANVNLFILDGCPVPKLDSARQHFLAHAALRLICNHEGYEPLWREQLGDAWREPIPAFSWPVLANDDARWDVRATIDAVVAQAYGLSRAQYEHVLSTFSHKSYPSAPALCLAAFDELTALGPAVFMRKHDPYHDIPLCEDLPKPVIDLPGASPHAAPEATAVAARKRNPQQLSLIVDNGPLFPQRAAQPSQPVASSKKTAPDTKLAQSKKAPEEAQPGWRGRTPVDRQMLILCKAVAMHHEQRHILGRVKAEKLVHLIEAHVGVDLERMPTRQAAGPADFPRLHQVVKRAKALHAFTEQRLSGRNAYHLEPDKGLGKRLNEYDQVFANVREQIDHLLGQFVKFDSNRVELVATLYAVWHDILASGTEPDDRAILDGLYGWSPEKQKYPRSQAQKALDWMRQHQLVPTGKGPVSQPKGSTAAKATGKAPRKDSAPAATHEKRALDKLISLLARRSPITSADAQEATGLDAAGVRPYLHQLVAEGHAVVQGKGRGTQYHRASDT
jgi:hypothetical protein